jgi:hypothetical protein
MEISSELILVFVAGFFIGSLITLIILLIIYDLQDRKATRKKEDRHLIINAIGRLCATIDNAYAAYRMGSMNFESLKEVLRTKIEEVNTQLTSNINVLDPYYVKNIERFIEDQKSFLIKRQDKEPVRSGELGIRSGSRDSYHLRDSVITQPEKPAPPGIESTAQTEVIPKKVEKSSKQGAPIMLESLPLDAAKKEKPPAKDKDKKKDKFQPEALTALESGATVRIAVDEVKKYKMPKPVTPFEPAPKDTKTEEKPFTDIAATKEFKIDTPEETSPPKTKSPEDKTMVEEKTVYDMPAYKVPEDDKKTVKGTTVFDTPIDVEATQEFNIQDLIENTKPHIKSDDKSKADDDSLITGDDVMDQMDSLFGFED